MSGKKLFQNPPPHTRAKHEILRRYLEAWLPIQSRYNQRIVYIDGFAGPGRYANGDRGSPLIALDAVKDHTGRLAEEIVFLFVEANAGAHRTLQDTLAEYECPRNVSVRPPILGQFDQEMTSVLDELDHQGSRLAPTFAFIDPFGFSGTPFSVVRRIMSHDRCETLITFMYEEINRFVAHPDRRIQAHFDDLFGTGAWRGAADLETPAERRAFLEGLYRDQLTSEAGVRYVLPFEMVNVGNRTDYFLFFCTNNYLGLKKMKQAHWRVDPASGIQFRDNSDGVPMLLEGTPQFERLARLISQWAAGTERSVEEIEQFVVIETPFIGSHIRRALAPLEKEGRVSVTQSERQRRFYYPAGTTIRFP